MATELASEKNHYETRRKRHSGGHGLTGPILLITLGVIFLVGQFVPGWGVSKTWPALLIVIGIAKLLDSARSRESAPPD